MADAHPVARQLGPLVLIAATDERDTDGLGTHLRRNGFRTAASPDGAGVLDVFGVVAPDLVLLGMLLDDLSGLEVCCRLRRRSNVPIVMITESDSVSESEVGLDLGADHYVVWPRWRRELVARLRAVIRTAHGHRPDALDEQTIDAAISSSIPAATSPA